MNTEHHENLDLTPEERCRQLGIVLSLTDDGWTRATFGTRVLACEPSHDGAVRAALVVWENIK